MERFTWSVLVLKWINTSDIYKRILPINTYHTVVIDQKHLEFVILVLQTSIKEVERLNRNYMLTENLTSLRLWGADDLSKARPHASTRSRFKLLLSKAAAYRNSVLPALSQLPVDRNAEIQNLSWACISYSPFPYSATALASTTLSSSKKKLKK